MNSKLKVIDLFCGCGGLSLGFLNTGKFDVIAGIDYYQDALDTFVFNHKTSLGLNLDLFNDDFTSEIIKNINNEEIDVVVGGPPCQGFSLTGPRNFDDKRNTLYLAMIKAVKDLKPKAFLIENVPGLANMYEGKVRDEILRRFEDLNFNVKYKVLLAADYGVPQMRKRVFFVGIHKKYGNFEFPDPKNNPNNYITTLEAISDLPSRENSSGNEIDEYELAPQTEYQIMMRQHSKKLHNHVASKHTDAIKKVIALVPDGGNYKDLPTGIGEHRKFNEAWTRYSSTRPSRTIDTGHRNHFHYKWNRVPTVRENARLQSFPDNFIFFGSKTSQYRQVGNAVPPKLAEAVASQIYKAIR